MPKCLYASEVVVGGMRRIQDWKNQSELKAETKRNNFKDNQKKLKGGVAQHKLTMGNCQCRDQTEDDSKIRDPNRGSHISPAKPGNGDVY